ncbi:MAG: acyltransferase, partial [Phycisphaerae bacterium]|nr:acyltransferase [Phycisphaerae bacterium]
MEQSGSLLIANPGAPGLSEAKQSVADPFFSGRKHLPALDGLRGAAIFLVLLCHYRDEFGAFGRIGHALAHVFGWGWVGVDLFFVLSGFLITGILYDCKGQESYFKNFYARRFLRIFPLYYGFLALFLLGLIVYRFGFPQDFSGSAVGRALWRYQPWLWTYTFNFRCALHGNTGLVVSQFWTLSIEEQFYLFWPLTVFLLPRGKLIYACVGIGVGSLVLRLIAAGAGASAMAIYTATPFQLDALATGSLLAMLVRGPVALGRIDV